RHIVQSVLKFADPGNTPLDMAALLRQEGRTIRRLDAVERRERAARRPEPVANSLEGSRIVRDGIKAGTPAPAFRLPDIHGGEVTLEQFRGRCVLLVFSDPHCGPCMSLAPELARFSAKSEGKGVVVVMITRGDVEENRLKAEKYKFHFPVVF